MAESRFVYVTYIRVAPERVWEALTTDAFMKDYFFGVHFDTDWKPGSPWRMVHRDGDVTDVGEIIEFSPPSRLVLAWQNVMRDDLKAEGMTRMTAEIEPVGDAASKLTLTHVSDVENSKVIGAVSGGWPSILSNLKSLLETGEVVVTRF